MSGVLVVAVFFVVWWLVLFAVLPFGLKTQDEDDHVTLGTVSSAPRGPHMLRAALWTTLITLVLFAVYYWVTSVLGLGLDDIPRIGPDVG